MVSPVRVLWRAMAAKRRELLLAGILGAVAAGSAVALLGTSAWLIATAAQMPPVLTLTVAAVMVRTLALSRAIFRYGERLVGHDAAFRGLTELRVVVYAHLERLAPTGLAAFSRGDLLARLVADVDAALDLPLRVVLPWFQAVVVAAGTVAFLSWLLPSAGLAIGLLSVAAIALTPWLVARAARVADARMAPARAHLTTAVVRVLDATSVVTVFGAESAVTRRVAELDGSLTRLNARESFALGLGGGIGTVVQGMAVTAAFVVTIPAVTSGVIEPVWLAVIALVPLALFDVLNGLPSSALAYQRLRGSAVRVAEVEHADSPVTAPLPPATLDDGFTGLRLRGVTARWPAAGDGDAPAIVGLDLDVEPGERIAIVGPSGSGKSTLAAVLMGFLPYTGSVVVSGAEVRDCDGDELRRRIGLLTQQAHMFDTSIADNIRLGDPQADEAHVVRAMEQAQLAAWVGRLPDGADSTVGSFGVAISGGERQRIALARLLLAARPLVILDEPTEHLDGPTADALTRTLRQALDATTVLTITHRLLGLEDSHRIVELQAGRIAAVGTHGDLIAVDGWYARQWRLESERHDMAALLPSLPIGRGVPGPVG